MADRRPVPYQGQPPAPRGQSPAPRGPSRLPVPAGPTPVHQPRSLTFVDSTGTREALWERLPTKVREKVAARYGQLLDWWADDDEDGRLSAVVFGDQALVTVEPAVSGSGGSAYRVASIPLDPSSFRSAPVTGPTGGGPSIPSTGPAPRGGPGSSRAPAARIDRSLAGFLGHLPVRAQELLQEPFRAGDRELDWRYHYQRTGSGRGLSGATLQVWCYLTDLRTVTFVAGTGSGARDGGGAESWRLTCWRASRR